MSTFDADLAIVGGGPGGAATALAAAQRDLKVVLFEQHGAIYDKPCGEGIMPSGVDALNKLGLNELLSEARPFAGLRYVIENRPPLDIPMVRGGVSLQRPRLQACLNEALDAEPNIQRVRSRVEALQLPQGFLMRGGRVDFTASHLVAADGSLGGTARWLRGQREQKKPGRFGLRARFAPRDPLDRVEIHLGRTCEVYLTPLPGGDVNAALLFRSPPKNSSGPDELLKTSLEQTPSCLHRLGELITRPSSRRLDVGPPRRLAGNRAYLVGDAGGGVDPILGCGVTIALSSGILAADCVAESLAGAVPGSAERRYARGYKREATMRRHLAWTLRHMAPHPKLMGAVASAGRTFPPLLQMMVGIVTGPTPRRRTA